MCNEELFGVGQLYKHIRIDNKNSIIITLLMYSDGKHV